MGCIGLPDTKWLLDGIVCGGCVGISVWIPNGVGALGVGVLGVRASGGRASSDDGTSGGMSSGGGAL